MLAPGKMKARKLKKGDIVLEGSSVVTDSKAFVRFVLGDKSSMNIGPSSKIVLSSLPKQDLNVIKLLSGVVKAHVIKSKDERKKKKLLVKTQNAVLGVRGTKFQSTYNPVNKATSLITVEGEVSMLKVADKVSLDEASEAIDKSSDVVEVRAGRYSGTMAKSSKASVPQKIAPKQYDVLAKSMGSKKRATEVMKTIPGDPSPEGFIDQNTENFAPKAGGYLDFKTGIYVPPEDTAKLDKTTGTYKAKEIGNIDPKSADYVPPKGFMIDEHKGFVLKPKYANKKLSKSAKQNIVALNSLVKDQIVEDEKVSKKKKVKVKKVATDKSSWLPEKHIISYEFMPYSETFMVKDNFINEEFELNSKQANLHLLTWQQVWNKNWSTRIRMGDLSYEFASEDYEVRTFSRENDDGIFSFGVLYQYNKRLTLSADIIDRPRFYAIPLPGFDPNFKQEFEEQMRPATSMDLAANYDFLISNKWNFGLDAILHLFGEQNIPAGFDFSMIGGDSLIEESAQMFGVTLAGHALCKMNKKFSLDSSLWFNTESATADSIEYRRRSFGLGLKVNYEL